MHRITKFDIRNQYNEYVDPRVVEIMVEKVEKYNALFDTFKNNQAGYSQSETVSIVAELKRMYLEILYTNPSGFELTARLTTNYRCLKHIYIQRKDHRLPEWREFCKWIETLPYAKEFILCDID